MRFTLYILLIFSLMACAPRDGERQQDGNSDFSLKSGQVLSVSGEGEKLSTCDKPGDDVWDTLRLYDDLSFLFNRVGELKAVVGKGHFNCVQVSSSKTVEITTQNSEGKHEGTGVYYYVSKIELMNTDDLLNNDDRMKDVANAMAVSTDELVQYLNTEPQRDHITITWLTNESSGKSSEGSDLETLTALWSPEDDGQTLSAKCGDDNWSGIRIYPDQEEVFKEVIAERKLEVFVSPGDFNCLVVGEKAYFSYKNEDGDFVDDQSQAFIVEGVTTRAKSEYLNDRELSLHVAEDMGLSLEDFTSFLESLKKPQVNSVYLKWVEGSND